MTEEDQKNYPEFTKFVKGIGKEARENGDLWSHLKHYGGFTDESLTETLKWGSGPLLIFEDPGHAGPAWFDKKIRAAIFVNSGNMGEFESYDPKYMSGDAVKSWTRAYLFHETVNYGAFNNKHMKNPDVSAHEFNKKVYKSEYMFRFNNK